MITNLTKIEAAHRQLSTAIELFFTEGDPVSIHTLAAAAHQIILDIYENRFDRQPFWEETFRLMVKEEYLDEVRRTLRRAQNFFKHADRDAEETMDFNPQASMYTILLACALFEEIIGEMPKEFHVFTVWMKITKPNIFTLNPKDKKNIEKFSLEIQKQGKTNFYYFYISHANSI